MMGMLEELKEEVGEIKVILQKIVKTMSNGSVAPAVTSVTVIDPDDEVEDEEEEKPVKKSSKSSTDTEAASKRAKASKGTLTLVQVTAKLREVLQTKGRPAAVAILEEFEAEKVGDVEEAQYPEFVAACEKALVKKAKVKDEEEEDDIV